MGARLRPVAAAGPAAAAAAAAPLVPRGASIAAALATKPACMWVVYTSLIGQGGAEKPSKERAWESPLPGGRVAVSTSQ